MENTEIKVEEQAVEETVKVEEPKKEEVKVEDKTNEVEELKAQIETYKKLQLKADFLKNDGNENSFNDFYQSLENKDNVDFKALKESKNYFFNQKKDAPLYIPRGEVKTNPAIEKLNRTTVIDLTDKKGASWLI
jgi:hypothetical protein